jgi:hypothetical protein
VVVEQNGQPPTGSPDSQSYPPSPVVPGLEERIMALESRKRARVEEAKSDQLVRDVKKGEWWLIGINALLLIATILIAFIYYGQLSQMRIATKATQDAVCVASRTLAETVRSNRAQELSSSRAFQATIDNFHQDQRAWVTINAVSLRPLKDGDFVAINQATVNGGKTIAFDVFGANMIAFPTVPLKVFPYFDAQHKTIKQRNLGLMVPGVPYAAEFHSVGTLDGAQINAIKTGRLLIEEYGYLKYRDAAKAWHRTEYCFIYSVAMDGLVPCENHNSAD